MGKFDVLREAGFEAGNYDLGTDDIIARLEAWDATHGLELESFDGSSLTVRLLRLPDDLDAFSEEVYAFCPDIVWQGCETVEALAASIAETSTVFLWWD
ncbi:DUF4253 domain-containing protein [Myxococcota bacterium]|nr:DUF4253 domain-containing protein [Myxococcota bacterium]